jgi:signal transduction histidine kinase
VDRDVGHITRRIIAVPAVGLAIVCVLLLLLVRALVGEADEVERAERVRSRLHEVHTLLLEQEASLRGIQLAPEPEQLRRYHEGAAALPSALGELDALLAGRPDAVAGVEEIRRLYAGWSASASLDLRPPADDTDDGGATRMRERASTMDGVRIVIASMIEREDRRIAGLKAAVARAKLGSAWGTAGVAILLAIAAGTVLRRALTALARRYDRALRAQNDAVRAKDEFLAMLGHELRNPLAPIRVACELARRHGNSDRTWQVVERQVEHMTRLVDDLLDVSRITRGELSLRRERIDLATVIARAAETVGCELDKRRQRLELRVPAELVVDGDPARLAQVFCNLLANASKYGGEDSTIEVDAVAEGDRIAIHVRDHGIGIASDLQGRVFDLFVQESQEIDRRRGGLGLGLAIVRSVVQQHGGTVRVASDGPGRGSVFTVELPAAEPEPTGTRAISAPHEVAGATGKRVLVVDDNEDAADVLASLLSSLGCEVSVAYDPISALEQAQQTKPELVLLDLGLPVMDGRRRSSSPSRATGWRATGRRPRLPGSRCTS